jgi:hypothetical protein
VALLIVLAGAGAGWALEQALLLLRPISPARVGRRAPSRAVVAAVALAVGIGFAAPSVQRFGRTMQNLEYQADLANELPHLVRAAGGAGALRRCGDPYTGPFLVPVVAWYLHVHTQQVQLKARNPAVVFRVMTTPTSRPVPRLHDVAGGKTLALGQRWRIVGACGSVAG